MVKRTMYEQRLTAFIDILGFGDLVRSSEGNVDLQKSISEALSSIEPSAIRKTDVTRVNESTIPPEELEAVRELAELFSEAVEDMAPITISYFSDSLVLSALASNAMACQMILHHICILSVRLWEQYHVTIRGGIALGGLYHVDGGQLFGPAMLTAYYLENKCADYPRVILDKEASKLFSGQETFQPMKSLLVNGGDFEQLDLATCYFHLCTSSSWGIGQDELVEAYRSSLEALPSAVNAHLRQFEDEKIRGKYRCLEVRASDQTKLLD